MHILLSETPSYRRSKDISAAKRHKFNFAFACLSSYLKKNRHKVTIVDPDNISQAEYCRMIKNREFGLSGMSMCDLPPSLYHL